MLHFATYYHIYNHANGDDNLFREEKNYDFFLKKYHQHIDPIADTVAWCLMKNHFHLLVKIKEYEAIRLLDLPNFKNLEGLGEQAASNLLTKQFSNFFNSYSKAFNKTYNRRGSLFQKNFKRKEISNKNYLLNLLVYIHLNPVKHGFTLDFENWTKNSYHQFPINFQELREALFGNTETYRLIHQQRSKHFEEYDRLEQDIIQGP